LRENLGIRTDGNFQVLRPFAAPDQFALQLPGAVGSGPHRRQLGADRLLQGIADDLGLPGIAAGSFLDEPLEQTDDESHTRRLDGLYIAGRAQYRKRAFRRPAEAITHQFRYQANGSTRHTTYKFDAVILVEKIRHGGRIGRNIEDLALPDDDDAGTAMRPWHPYPSHKRGLVDINRQVTDGIHLSDS